ncbi:MAG TPA: hypothetical protein ENJ00_02365 [Phycisphaerales bacterium]|nr:hypothetical protein [Phycisphaerales bacterium]
MRSISTLSPVLLLALAGSVSGQADGFFPASIDLSSLDGTNGFVINGIDSDDRSGWSVSSAGDVNGDGIDDLIIGAPIADPNGNFRAGESYVVFGRTTGFGASVELSSLDGTTGFIINGIDAGDYSGSSVSSAGDVNGDGIDDLIIGAPLASPNGTIAGESYVLFGRTTGFDASLDLSTLDGTTGFTMIGSDENDCIGGSVASAGDVNSDGIDDLLVGSWPTVFNQNYYSRTKAVVVFGQTTSFGASLDLSSLDGTNGFIMEGLRRQDEFGSSVSSAGDVNDDGIDDFIIGAPGFGDDFPVAPHFAGDSYVVFGRSTGLDASLDLSSLDGTTGFVVNGIDIGDHCGESVSTAGDINGDGIDDLLIGVHYAGSSYGDPNGNAGAGESYVVFGRTSGFSASLDPETLDGVTGFVLNGIDASDFSGVSVSTAGDVNGDGIDDLIIGAFGADPNGNSAAGESYVVFGRRCRADVNHDGMLTPTDFTAWITSFNANAPECDQNDDGVCTPADVDAWIANFNAGCG